MLDRRAHLPLFEDETDLQTTVDAGSGSERSKKESEKPARSASAVMIFLDGLDEIDEGDGRPLISPGFCCRCNKTTLCGCVCPARQPEGKLPEIFAPTVPAVFGEAGWAM